MKTSTRGLLLAVVVGILVLSTLPATVALADSSSPTLTVAVAALNLRGGPGTNYPILGSLTQGEQATITGRDAAGGWYQVQLGSGSTGWVSGAYVQVAGDASSVPVAAAPAAPAATTTTRQPAGSLGHIMVFQSSSGGAIYAVNPDGTGLRYLTNGIDPAISPDRQWVAFTRWDASQNGAPGSLWVIRTDGTGERQVLSGLSQPKSPTWSSDGQEIIISMQQGGTIYPTYSCFVNGKLQQNLPQPIPGVPCRLVAADPHWGLRTVTVASGSFQDLPHAAHSFAPAFDPKNPWRVVYHGDRGLVSLDVTQGQDSPLTNDPSDRSPVFSPDGTKIATSYWQTDHWEVHVMNADGTNAVRLTETPLRVIVDQQIQGVQARSWNNAAPAWSPDGSQIAFVTDRTGQWELWVMNVDGSNQHPLLPASALNGISLQYNGVDERVISWR